MTRTLIDTGPAVAYCNWAGENQKPESQASGLPWAGFLTEEAQGRTI
jgi:hypothetical protein